MLAVFLQSQLDEKQIAAQLASSPFPSPLPLWYYSPEAYDAGELL